MALKAWGTTINRMVSQIAQAQGPARPRIWPGVQAHQAAADDFRHIGSGVDAQGQGAYHGVVPAGLAKMTEPMISSWTIMGVPRMTVT